MFYQKPYLDALIIVLIVLLFFGPKRLPGLGKSLGQGMREFKDSITGKSPDSGDEQRPELEAAAVSQPAEPAQPAVVASQPEQSDPR